jgi:hypothetical protein
MSKKTKVKNPVTVNVESSENKITRGGSYFTHCSVYYRSNRYITHRSNTRGFRICLKRKRQ